MSVITQNELGIILMRSKYDFKTRKHTGKSTEYAGTIADLPKKYKHLLPKDLDGHKFCRIFEK